MARLAGKEPIYTAATLFRQRCVAEQSSLLWPDSHAWTAANIDAVWKAVIENPIETGDLGFFDKLELQLSGLPDDVYRVVADAVAFYHLYPTNILPTTKNEQVRRVASWKFPEDPPELGVVAQAFDAVGIGHSGSWYVRTKWLQIPFYALFAQELRDLGSEPYELSTCKAAAESVEARLPQHATAARNIVLYLLFPDQLERISSADHKQRVVKTFRELSDGAEDIDDALANIRRGLVAQTGREDIDFYDPDIREKWQPPTPKKGKPKKDEVVATEGPQYWIEKTEVRGRPDREGGPYALGSALWSPEAAKDGHDIYRFMREVEPGDLILHLTDNQALTGISVAASACESFDGIPNTKWGTGPSYLVRLSDHRKLDPPLDREVFFGPDFRDRLAAIAQSGDVKNLFFTQTGELNQGAYLTPGHPDVLDVLDDAYKSISGRTLTLRDFSPDETTIPTEAGANLEYSLKQCAEETGFDEQLLSRWVRAIERKGQAVFYGPPGTGKTFIAERLAQHIIGGGTGFRELVQFHPAYAYEDFIQGIRPHTDSDGDLSYRMIEGRFLQFCERASARTDRCVLIIDEINRANLSRVFGELMYLLEYRGDKVPLAGGGSLQIPKNVRMIGTMNTADRSIALVDHALRRRFAFLALRPEFEILRRYHERERTGFVVDPLISQLRMVNRQINDPNYEVGITFFLRTDLDRQIEDIWRMEIEPYLEEYFFAQPEKVADFRWDKVGDTILPSQQDYN